MSVTVQKLRLEGFTCHRRTELTFPASGIVVVTGANGSGKSSVIEGVAWGTWGETLRGAPPGGRDDACKVSVELAEPKLRATRTRRKAKTVLAFEAAAPDGRSISEEYPTTTKAQEALERHVGTFEVWRRTHVFSSADAAHFTLATDKARKLFLEALLGLGRFDDALARCRRDAAIAQQAHAGAQAATNAAHAAVQVATARIKAWEAERPPPVLGALEDESSQQLQEACARLARQVRVAEQELERLRRDMQTFSASEGGIRREITLLGTQLERLRVGSCSACGQPFPADKLPAAEAAHATACRRLATAEAEAAARKADIQAEFADTEETLRTLRTRESAARAELAVWTQKLAERRQAEAARAEAERRLEGYKRDLVAAQEAVAAAEQRLGGTQREVDVCEAAERVLGLRGVRVSILARLLSHLERAANAWLPRLAGPGVRVELKPYSENKTGGVSDAISIAIEGVGGGEGYKAMSGGERRRVDVALLLALAGDGTLFFDEVFDALDGEGIAVVVEVLRELAQSRCVVVVTHSEELAARLPAALTWRSEQWGSP